MSSPACALHAISVASAAIISRLPHRRPCRTSTADSTRASARYADACDASAIACAFASHSAAMRSSRSDAASVSRLGSATPCEKRERSGAFATASRRLPSRRASNSAASSRSISARNVAPHAVVQRGDQRRILGATALASSARVICRKLMPRSSIREPSGTERSAVTRMSNSCRASRFGRNATTSDSSRPVRSRSSVAVE